MSTVAGTHAGVVLQQLLCGQPAAAEHLANALRAEAHGHRTFGRTDALDLFATHPLALSGAAQVLLSPKAMAVVDDTVDGRTVGVFADLLDGVIGRLWVVAATAADATAEPTVAVARDDFMSQLRQHCEGDAADHPGLQAGAWPHVVELGNAALGTRQAPAAASSSQAWVMRAFGCDVAVVALYRLRVLSATVPRQAHHRLALAVAHLQADDTRRQHRLALSDPLPEPAPLSF